VANRPRHELLCSLLVPNALGTITHSRPTNVHERSNPPQVALLFRDRPRKLKKLRVDNQINSRTLRQALGEDELDAEEFASRSLLRNPSISGCTGPIPMTHRAPHGVLQTVLRHDLCLIVRAAPHPCTRFVLGSHSVHDACTPQNIVDASHPPPGCGNDKC